MKLLITFFVFAFIAMAVADAEAEAEAKPEPKASGIYLGGNGLYSDYNLAGPQIHNPAQRVYSKNYGYGSELGSLGLGHTLGYGHGLGNGLNLNYGLGLGGFNNAHAFRPHPLGGHRFGASGLPGHGFGSQAFIGHGLQAFPAYGIAGPGLFIPGLAGYGLNGHGLVGQSLLGYNNFAGHGFGGPNYAGHGLSAHSLNGNRFAGHGLIGHGLPAENRLVGLGHGLAAGNNLVGLGHGLGGGNEIIGHGLIGGNELFGQRFQSFDHLSQPLPLQKSIIYSEPEFKKSVSYSEVQPTLNFEHKFRPVQHKRFGVETHESGHNLGHGTQGVHSIHSVHNSGGPIVHGHKSVELKVLNPTISHSNFDHSDQSKGFPEYKTFDSHSQEKY